MLERVLLSLMDGTQRCEGPFQGILEGALAVVSALLPCWREWSPPRSSQEPELEQAYYSYPNAQTSEESLAGDEELQQVLPDQLAVETTYDTFLSLLYHSDADKQAAIRAADSSSDNRDCEMNTHSSELCAVWQI